MDKVLKRRLIGASILIALAVIFLPMLLVESDPAGRDSGGEIDLPPVPDSAREVRRIPLDPEAARARQPDREGPAPETGRLPDRERDGTSPADRDIETEILDEIRLSPEDGPQLDEAAVAEAPQPDRAVEAGTPARPAPPSSDLDGDAGIRAEADNDAGDGTAAASESPPDSTDSTAEWIVQVASFGSAESSDRVRQRLEALGHVVARDEIVRGEILLYRLRTGPYRSRQAADNARVQIAATVNGVEPLVRRIEPGGPGDSQGGFAVQVGSFVGDQNALSEVQRLSALGFDAFRASDEVGGRTIWRVLVGPVDDREQAERLKTRLADEAGVEGLVTSHP